MLSRVVHLLFEIGLRLVLAGPDVGQRALQPLEPLAEAPEELQSCWFRPDFEARRVLLVVVGSWSGGCVLEVLGVVGRRIRSRLIALLDAPLPASTGALGPALARLAGERLDAEALQGSLRFRSEVGGRFQLVERHILDAGLVGPGPNRFSCHLFLRLHSLHLGAMPGGALSVFLRELVPDLVLPGADPVALDPQMHFVRVFVQHEVLFLVFGVAV